MRDGKACADEKVKYAGLHRDVRLQRMASHHGAKAIGAPQQQLS